MADTTLKPLSLLQLRGWELPTFRFTFLRRYSWRLLRWAAFSGSMLYTASICTAEYHFVHSFIAKDVQTLLLSAQKAEATYPFDYRFRNRPVRTAIELAMAGHVAVKDLQPFLADAYKTDPLDLELIWNVGIWLREMGNLDGSKQTLIFATRLAPGNALVARALQEVTAKQETTK